MESQGMTDKQFETFLKALLWVVEKSNSVDEAKEHIKEIDRGIIGGRFIWKITKNTWKLALQKILKQH